MFDREGLNWTELRDATRDALAPVPSKWLAERLRLLWKSSTPSGSLEASAWVLETGRLLSDLPLSVLAWAIDEAVRRSERGFLPSVGEIRKHAEPMHTKLRTNLARLERMCAGPAPELPKPRPLSPEERCTPEQAREIRERMGLNLDDDEPKQRADYIPVEQRQAPTREDYIRWGIDPATLAA